MFLYVIYLKNPVQYYTFIISRTSGRLDKMYTTKSADHC